jgi:putative transposase
MKRFSFKKGLVFIRGDRRFTIVRRLIDGNFQLEADDGELLNCSEAEILTGCSQGLWLVDESSLNEAVSIDPKISRDLSSFSKPVQDKVRKREEYLTRIIKDEAFVINFIELKKQITQVASDIGDNSPPSPITFYRWYKRKQKAGDSIIALADHFEKRGRRQTWSKVVKQVVDNAIETVYLNHQLYPKKAVCEEVERNLNEMHKQSQESANELKLPSQSSIYRYLDKLESYNVASARLGKQVADSRFRSVTGKQNATRLLERWEIDHTPIDSLIICEKTLLPLGRPWLTIIIDKYSRMVVGFYISFRAPSAYAVLQCLKQAILPKDELLKKYPDITTPWPARGIPEMIVCDNGMDLHAKALMNLCQELGIQIQFCPAKTPQYKGAVERFFRTMSSDLIHRLPGSVFSSVDKRGDYPSEERACITFDTLEHLITKWIVEIYNQTHHRGLI